MSKKYQAGGGGSMGSNFGRTTAAGGTGSRGSARGTSIKPDATRRANKAIKPAKPKTVTQRETRKRITDDAIRTRVKPKRYVGTQKGFARKGKPVTNVRKVKNKSVTTMFAPDREVLSQQFGMSSKMTNKQMRAKAGKSWNLSVPKNSKSFKQARKATEKDKVRYNTLEKRINKTEKTLGSPVMWNFKPTLYNKSGNLTNAKTRSFPKKTAPVKPSSGRMNKKSKKK